MNARLSLPILLLVIPAFVPLLANNIQVTQTVLAPSNKNTSGKYWDIKFKLTWSNSWHNANSSSRDAAWIFIKYRKVGTATWHHAYLDSNSLNHGKGSCGTGCGLEVGLKDPSSSHDPSTNPALGVFLHKTPVTGYSDFMSENISIRWKYADNNARMIDDNDPVEVRVYAVEMVYVPQGDFMAGHADATNRFRKSDGGENYPISGIFSDSTLRTSDTISEYSTISSVDPPYINLNNTGDVTINSIDVPNLPDRVLMVGVAVRENGAGNNPVTQVTYNGTPLSLVHSQSTTNDFDGYIYALKNPEVGNGGTLIVDVIQGDGSKGGVPIVKGVGVVAAIFTGVDLDNTFGAVSAIYKTGNPYEITLNPTSGGDVIFDILGAEANSNNVTPAQTLIAKNAGTNLRFGASWKTVPEGSSSTKMTWTLSSAKKTVMVGAVLKRARHYNNDGLLVSGEDGIKRVINGVESEQNGSFPTGYKAFYCMKYEVTQGQYAAFLNTLSVDEQTARIDPSCDPLGDPVGTPALDPAAGSSRNHIVLQMVRPPFPAIFGCDRNGNGVYNESDDGQYVACNFLCWDDLAAWLDWAGLRPMTELEYEKACRGVSNNAHKYPWGSTTSPTAVSDKNTDFSSFNTNGEVPNGSQTANVHYNQNGGNGVGGPFRVGGYARTTGNTKRKHAGVTTTGILDMAGNVWEMVVSLEDAAGRAFAGNHGNGQVDSEESWPGYPASNNEYPGITARGGSWETTVTTELMVSDRTKANVNMPATRSDAAAYGGRGVRSTFN